MNRIPTICLLLIVTASFVFGQDDVQQQNLELKGDDFLELGQVDSALYYYDKAGVAYRSQAEFASAFDAFFKAFMIRDTIPGSDLALSYLYLGSVQGMRGDDSSAFNYFNRAYQYASDQGDTSRICSALTNQAVKFREFERLDTALVLLQEAEQLGTLSGMSSNWFATLYNNFAICYQDKSDFSKAIEYYKKTYSIWSELGNQFQMALICNNIGNTYHEMKQYDSAADYYYMALSFADRANAANRKLNTVENLVTFYTDINQKDSVIKYLNQRDTLKDEISESQLTGEIERLQMQYDYEKVARINAQQRIEIEKASNQRRLLLILLLSLLLISLVFYLFYKRRSIKREKEFSRINELLKNQEIKSYQLVMDAQEEERQRIAGELHDRLGSTLSAAKLYFNNMEDLKNGQEARAMKKGVKLLDEAVQDVRNISHNMASGVLAKYGLEHALIDLRETISGSGGLKMKVITHGLDRGISREIQLHVYRMIQELVSNALKHSGAREIIVQVTRHEDELTVTVEDNGSGFKEKGAGEGLGLKNMERRVELLNGSYHIDTGRDIGTIVTIDIPINYDKTYTSG